MPDAPRQVLRTERESRHCLPIPLPWKHSSILLQLRSPRLMMPRPDNQRSTMWHTLKMRSQQPFNLRIARLRLFSPLPPRLLRVLSHK
jgi:hypothetical protein